VKTTKRQFRMFCEEFTRLCERLGLMEWRLDFRHEDTGDNRAQITFAYIDRVARVSLNVEMGEPYSDETIIEDALHEALELLTADVYALMRARWVSGDEIEAARHTLIRRLEKVLK
jgi:hypothetical protein